MVRKMAECIWKVEWNKDLFCNATIMSIFITKLAALTHEDPKNRASLSSILKTLTFHLFNFQLPNCCFCYEIQSSSFYLNRPIKI